MNDFFSTINSLVLQPSPTDLFEDVLQPVKTMIDCKDNPFEVEIQCDDDLAIDIDKMRLKQVVLNLAGNARKFVQRGFIRLTARLVEPEGKIRLAVEDSGPGEYKNKLSAFGFELFVFHSHSRFIHFPSLRYSIAQEIASFPEVPGKSRPAQPRHRHGTVALSRLGRAHGRSIILG